MICGGGGDRTLSKSFYGMLFRLGDFDSHGVDCPFPFAHKGRYFMTYVGYDGTGYRTGLASSDDLKSWQKEGLILDRGPAGSPTEFNVALTSILRDNELYGPGTLRKADGRFVGTYHAYPTAGYEAGAAIIGLCFSDNLTNWEVSEPILTADPNCAWEAGGLYKSWLMEHDGTYYLFYNAKDLGKKWHEQTGVATSRDLMRWDRSPMNPLAAQWTERCVRRNLCLRSRGAPGQGAVGHVLLRHGRRYSFARGHRLLQ